MKKPNPRQLELFSGGARAVSAAKRPKPDAPDEVHLQAKLDCARRRLRHVIVFGLRPWLSEDTLAKVRYVESCFRAEIRVHFRILERFRAGRRQREGGEQSR
jgi:hypothetical protein